MKVSNIFWAQRISKFLTSLIDMSNLPYAIRSGFKGGDVKIPSDFKPVIRFIACSDIHVRADGHPETAERFGQLFDDMYAYSDQCDSYKNLDAVLVAGDFTGRGDDAEYTIFNAVVKEHKRDETHLLPVLGNHEFIAYRDVDASVGYTHYKAHISEQTDTDTVINGYHFIGVSYDKDGKRFETKAEWLKKTLDAATAEDPGKPVIVFHHPHPFLTVYGSVDWGNKTLRKVLERYPQAVSFSGHSHYFPGDPRSVWQGGFTAVGCGSMMAFMGNMNYIEGDKDAPGKSGGAWLVECDANGSILMRLYDIANRRFFDDVVYYFEDVADKSKRNYTWHKQRSKDTPVRFREGKYIGVTRNAEGDYVMEIPEAKGYYKAENYKIKVTDRRGKSIFETTVISDYVRSTEGIVSVNLGKPEPGSYKAIIKAYSPYAKKGDCAVVRFETM